jgi:DNA invertase Pin-like site-specific DNA recombinase
MNKRISWLRSPRKESPPGKGSDYIQHFDSRIVGILVVLYCRVSGRMQDHRGNLDDQEAADRRWLEDNGATVVAVYRDVASGWNADRPGLMAALEKAREVGAIVVARSTDRFIRSIDYTPENPQLQPTVEEYEKLRLATNGVTLATILPPDTPWQEIRGQQSKRGQEAKGQRGGRPQTKEPGWKKRRQLANLPKLRWMVWLGISHRRIAGWLNVPRTTIQRWIQNYL